MTKFFTRRALGALAATVLALTGGVVAAAPASSAAPPAPVLTDIRTGQHPGFDRVVLDWTGPAPGVRTTNVAYLRSDGSGAVFWLTGEYFNQTVANPAHAHRPDGSRSYANPNRFRTPGLRNVMAVGVVGDYEGYVTVGLGTRYRSWVRTFTLTSPTRVVIDVGS